MLILHVSDIHFRAPECTSDLDPNRAYRTRMMQDARARTSDLGTVDAILIGGDIAYKADPFEYEAAHAWIEDLARECGCPMERIFVVPGNHDVNRSIILSKRSIQNVHRAVIGARPEHRDRELQAQLTDNAVGHALFEPLAAYNDFAKKFNCQIYPSKLSWRQDISLDSAVTLRLHGLTSTLLSGAVTNHGQDDTRGSLYLSQWQTGLDPADNVINLVMSHHPPDWFMDQDSVDDAINGRAALQFFGHKHRQRVNRESSQYMRFNAGALNPDPNEIGWHPAYNMIRLKIEGSGDSRVLMIEAHLLGWQPSPERYFCVQDPYGEEVWRHTIPCPGRHQLVTAQAENQTPAVPQIPQDNSINDPEAAMGEQSTRKLVLRFWQLPMDARRKISLQMGLIDESEIALPEPERYGRALGRAGERGLLQKLAEEVEKWPNK